MIVGLALEHLVDGGLDLGGHILDVLIHGDLTIDQHLDVSLQNGADTGNAVVTEVVSTGGGSSKASLDEVFREVGISSCACNTGEEADDLTVGSLSLKREWGLGSILIFRQID